MSKTKYAVISGDNHLRPVTWTKHPTLRDDAYNSLEQLVDYCLHNSLPLILLGDIFDKANPDSHSVTFFVEQMSRMEHGRLPVYYIQGNHDQANPPWPSVHPWCQHAAGQLIELGPFKFFGIDPVSHDQMDEAFATIPAEADGILCHQSWLEIQRVGHTDASFTHLPRGMLVLTGDYHIHSEFGGEAANGDTVIGISPGSTSMQALNEEPVKQFYVLCAQTDTNAPCFESEILSTRRFFHSSPRNEEEFGHFISELLAEPPRPEGTPKPILRVRFNDEIPDALSRLVAAVGDNWHLFDEPQRVTDEVVIDNSNTREGAFDSLLSAVGELCGEGTETYIGVRRLLESTDPKAELERLFEEFKQNATQPQEDATGVQAGDVAGSPAG